MTGAQIYRLQLGTSLHGLRWFEMTYYFFRIAVFEISFKQKGAISCAFRDPRWEFETSPKISI